MNIVGLGPDFGQVIEQAPQHRTPAPAGLAQCPPAAVPAPAAVSAPAAASAPAAVSTPAAVSAPASAVASTSRPMQLTVNRGVKRTMVTPAALMPNQPNAKKSCPAVQNQAKSSAAVKAGNFVFIYVLIFSIFPLFMELISFCS